VVADLGTETDFFVLALVAVTFVLPFLLLVLELAKVHDATDGRLFGRGDLDQIESGGTGLLERFVGADDS
jgi:hypothetical protein